MQNTGLCVRFELLTVLPIINLSVLKKKKKWNCIVSIQSLFGKKKKLNVISTSTQRAVEKPCKEWLMKANKTLWRPSKHRACWHCQQWLQQGEENGRWERGRIKGTHPDSQREIRTLIKGKIDTISFSQLSVLQDYTVLAFICQHVKQTCVVLFDVLTWQSVHVQGVCAMYVSQGVKEEWGTGGKGIKSIDSGWT